jgi:LuxR family maltose regulon positive regulatory protein
MRHPEVDRTNLLERSDLRDKEILAVAAPAGFGKSTVAIQWGTRSTRPLVWLTVDGTENDPHVLVAGLVAAFGQAMPFDVDFPPVWDEPFYSRLVVPNLLSAISHLPPVTLVVDDVHLLTGTGSLSLLKSVVDALPEGSQTALVGRDLHALPVPLWRGQGRIADLRTSDLSFTPEQTAAAVHAFGRPEDADAIHAAADGWPVAVFLLSQAQATRPVSDIEEFIVAEVLATMDGPLRDFVLATAPLGTVTADLAAEVGDTLRAGHFLAEATSTVLVQAGSEWFYYHPLLQQAVTALLQREDPARLSRVRAQAARWYLRHGHLDTAVHLALQSDDEAALGEVLWDASRISLLAGRVRTVQTWCAALPEETLTREPGASLAAAWLGVVAGDYGSVLRHGRSALQAVAGAPPQGGSAFGGYLDLLQAVTWIDLSGPEEALPVAVAARAAIADDDPTSALATLILGIDRALLGDPGAEQDLRQAVALAESFAVPSTQVEALALLGLFLVAHGEPTAGCDAIERAGGVYAFHDLSEMGSSSGMLFLATVALTVRRGQRADVEVALAQQAGIRAELEAVFPWYRPLSGAVLADVSMRLGDVASYHEYLQWCQTSVAHKGLCQEWAAMARRRYAAASPLAHLTPAELRVWDLLRTRMTLSEIAESLFLSRETVKTHTGSIYRKLGVASRREAQELADSWL